MPKLVYLNTIIIWYLGFIIFLLSSLFAFIAYPFDRLFNKSGDLVHIVSRYFGRLMLWVGRIKVEAKGLENLYFDRGQLICSNHQSLFDIFILDSLLPIQFRFVVKKELFAMPILGKCLEFEQDISLDRENRRKGIESMKMAGRMIASKRSIVIFPEGTRSIDGKVKEFRKGSMLIATSSNAPIIPVTIDGTFMIKSKNSILIHPRKVRVIIGKPIDTQGLSRVEQKELAEKVRHVIIDQMENTGGNDF